ncbi:MAG: alpha-hydroxy-acid oxidizing protein, partial [Blautia sp.]|nr:alpha-hydroxy-acid oxidizing protein [Blautia sp.]
IETRYLDSTNPTLDFTLYGEQFASPIMTAALSHLDHFMFPGATECYAKGAKDAEAVLWIGMAEEAEIEMCAGTGARVIEIIKPYQDRDLIYKKIDHAKGLGLLAVGIDIDHPFAEDGGVDVVDGYPMKALTTTELGEICAYTDLPVIVKGVLSVRDADRSLLAGAKGIVLSHHNNRIAFAAPPLALLPEIKEAVGSQMPIFVDGEIRTGMDAFKALALGATGVCIGRPLMAAIREDQERGVLNALRKANDELAKAMAYTGCTDLSKMDPSVIRVF